MSIDLGQEIIKWKYIHTMYYYTPEKTDELELKVSTWLNLKTRILSDMSKLQMDTNTMLFI